MDRYFYSVEMDGDCKVVHMSGNIYFNDADDTDTCYRIAEWTGLFITVKELKMLLETSQFYDYLNENVAYLTDMLEVEVADACQVYFDGDAGENLHISCVNEDTPCGDYWFE